MDLWKIFEMDEHLTELWKELGMSAGTAIVVLIALYFVIKWAVKNGILEAHKKMEEKKIEQKAVMNKQEVVQTNERNKDFS